MELLARYLERSERDDRRARPRAQRRGRPRAAGRRAHEPVRARRAASYAAPGQRGRRRADRLPASGCRDAPRAELAAKVTTIVHSAASVSFTLPLDEARAINRRGHARMLEFAALARRAAVSTATPTSRPRTSPGPTAAASASATSTSARTSATPTSSRSSRPSSSSAPGRGAVHDPAPEHRRRRPAQRLDVGVQRPLLAAAGVLARAVHGGSGDPVGARRRRLDRLRRRRDPRAVRVAGRIGETYHLTAGANASTIGEIASAGQPLLPAPAPARALAARVRGHRGRGTAARGARGEQRLLPVLLDRHRVRRRRHARAARAAPASASRRSATTSSGCSTSPRAAAGASARSRESRR